MPGCEFKRDAGFMPDSLDEKNRTVTVCFSTGHKGRRAGFWGDDWNEELEVSERAVRLDRLNNGAAVLDAHARWSIRDQIGVIERAWIEGGKAYATLRFSKRAEVEPIWQDVKDGVVRNVSVGYKVFKYEDVTESDDKIKTYRAVDWEPCEISPVPVGFDPGAQVRSASEPSSFETEIELRHSEVSSADPVGVQPNRGSNPDMTTPAAKQDGQTPAPAAQVDAEKIRSEAQAAERTRVAEIVALCTKHGIPANRTDDMIQKGLGVDQCRAEILEHLARAQEAAPTRSGVVEVVRDENQTKAEGIAEYVQFRADGRLGRKADLTEKARAFNGHSLIDLARASLEINGISTRGMSKSQVADAAFLMRRGMSAKQLIMTRVGAHTTSDFPYILANVMGKTLRRAYDEAPQTFRAWTRTATLPDFKAVSRVLLGEAPTLEEIKESGEYKYGTIGESKEGYQLKTYGKAIAISRQTLINDDLDAFSRIPNAFGRAAADFESNQVYAILTANAAMADNVALFHSTHKNLGTTGAPSETTLTELRKLMRKQTGINGRILNLMPKYLIVPAALEVVALKQMSAELVASSASNVNVFKNSMEVIVEPRLDATSSTVWYASADPAQIDTVEVGYLEGQQGLFVDTDEEFDNDGLKVKARLDFGVKAIDWRGMVKYP